LGKIEKDAICKGINPNKKKYSFSPQIDIWHEFQDSNTTGLFGNQPQFATPKLWRMPQLRIGITTVESRCVEKALSSTVAA
jgi:hypothetical protein